ncbi:uncharacterized protein HKW66_Vig0146940 [Vigna angularis]|uniref:Uncharacterized protein n=1 Tax=Phaseolus angularis TaxID=3914 RepID=A0A8T0JV43_PHAAN|nr:uncharacterized protein HKW66_Vig0146940 [Vigna angularis]
MALILVSPNLFLRHNPSCKGSSVCFFLTFIFKCDLEVVVYEGVIREKATSKEDCPQFLKDYFGGHAATVGSVLVSNLKTRFRKGDLDRVETGRVVACGRAICPEKMLELGMPRRCAAYTSAKRARRVDALELGMLKSVICSIGVALSDVQLEGRAAANFGEEECPVEKKKECGGMVEVKHTTLHAPAPAPASKGWCPKRNE